MLNFNKKGLICSYQTLDIPWYKKNTMVPITYLIDDKTLRIFIGMCDSENIGRIGYVDVNPNNPSEILDYSKNPSLDIGKEGCFDDNGVLPSGILEEDGKLYMFYSGYQLTKKVPYLIFAGIAVSEDKGKTFTRLSNSPFLDRSNEEYSIRAAANITRTSNNVYEILYLGGSDWIDKDGHFMPSYNIKYKSLKLNKITDILNDFSNPIVAVNIQGSDEFALAMPQVFIEGNTHKMIYSIRLKSKGYRMGYAESFDKGKNWQRMDDKIKIDVSMDGWDSEMICFGHMQSYKNKTYLFYCGNHYGMGGMGYAELIK